MRYKVILLGICMLYASSAVFALTSPYTKEKQLGIDLYLESDALDYLPPDWFQPTSLETASEDPHYWIQEVLPYAQDRDEDMYLVIPQLGLVTPIVDIPLGSSDYQTMQQGGEISINKYLEGGIIAYTDSAPPGHRGKRRDFGHSNYFRSDDGRYKTIFANLMALDPGDQIRYFVKDSTGIYELYKYRVDASYHTYPADVAPLQRDGEGADALIFGCTHGLDGRWMIEASYMGTPIGMPSSSRDTYTHHIPSTIKMRLDTALSMLEQLPTKLKKARVIQFYALLDTLKTIASGDTMKAAIVEYLTLRLVQMYPEI